MTRTKSYLYPGSHKDKLTSTSTHPSKGFGVVIYHVKRSYTHKDLSKSPPTNVMEPICSWAGFRRQQRKITGQQSLRSTTWSRARRSRLFSIPTIRRQSRGTPEVRLGRKYSNSGSTAVS
ncbi:hypothetical protein N7530_007371 [Penicillium desertorum]|uniref:Uncharacterized protein n=1 Tax=Penicillium desertorum TaxID=1303715 RepID=A0A9W9WM14_9EURO|nr:hypothetical protein N7530_007371 [Penicillium desertorum]